MSFEILLLFALLIAAMATFTLEWLPIDIVALVLVVTLVAAGILTPTQALASFGSEVVFVLASIFVLAGALVRTGALGWLGQALHRLAGHSEARILVSVMALSAAASAVISNTNATAVLMPATLELARKARVSARRLLMPLAYASMLGGTCTLIGTSTNLAANGLFQQLGLKPISLFEFSFVGLILVVSGITYMLLVGRKLIPDVAPVSLTEEYEIDEYLSEIVIPEGSSLAGARLSETPLANLGIAVLSVMRNAKRLFPGPHLRLAAADILIVQASPGSLLAAEEQQGLRLEATASSRGEDLVAGDFRLGEAIVLPQSSLVGKTVRDLRFRQTFGLLLIAIYRRGHAYPVQVRDLPLEAADVLLLQGPQERLAALERNRELWLLGEIARVPFARRRGTIALGALGLAIILGTAGVLPLSFALLSAALTVVLAGCVPASEVYRLVEWRLLVLIAGMMSFGVALQETGGADLMASTIVALVQPLGTYAILATFIIITLLLTQPLSNAAAALVVLPVAVATADQIGVDPRSLAMLVTLAASLSFIAPFEPACLLVYGPGKYRFRDFVKVGLPLTAVVTVLLLVLVPWFWPLRQ